MSRHQFSAFFGSVYRKPWTGSINPTCLSFLQISSDELSKAMKEADDNPNYDRDYLPMYFIKRCKPSFIKRILQLFNKSLSDTKSPDIWKSAYIQPI